MPPVISINSLPIFLPSLLLLLMLCSQTLCCFSSGDPNDERKKFPESAKLFRAAERQLDNKLPNDENAENVEFEVDKDFVRDYLKEFGHLSRQSRGNDSKENKTAELTSGIKHFQEFLNLKPTGKMDLPMLAMMNWKRCGNTDEGHSSPQIWERATLNWHLDSPFPKEFPLSQQDMKELIRQAFAAWEIVIAMDFLETNDLGDAQIIFGIVDDESANARRAGENRNAAPIPKTGMAIASAKTIPEQNSKIWINKHTNWSTFQTQEEGKVDVFLVLIHEIGHSLGLKHNGDQQSVMFPMFERGVGEQLPVISNDDVERLRAIYESSEQISTIPLKNAPPSQVPMKNSAEPAAPPPKNVPQNIVPEQQNELAPKCPQYIWAATNVNPETVYIFNGSSTWLFSQGKIMSGPDTINEIFPDGPDHVDVAFTSGRLTILMKKRILYGYTFDERQKKFSRAKGFPRELHNRILFTPEAAFPIANGSIILIKDKVFATYNVEKNTPHMLGDVDEYFPNLPQELRSGFPASADFSLYHMLTPEYAFLYDVRLTRSVGSQSVGRFLGCGDPISAGMPLPPPRGQLQLGPPGPIASASQELPKSTLKEHQQSFRKGPPAPIIEHPRGPPGLLRK